jgi:large conductance mechanosensitive channel
MLKEFKEFAIKGNAIDLAVAVIMGVAFGKIVSSLVEDLLMPLIGLFMGAVSFADLKFVVGDAVFAYGMLIQNIIDFIIIAFVIFILIRVINSAKKKEENTAPPEPSKEVVLLTEIRDLLKNNQ